MQWDDATSGMVWLDSVEPPDADPSTPGVVRGPCSTTSGNATYLQETYPNAQVTWSNIKTGDLDTTY